jgi:DNA processing protein
MKDRLFEIWFALRCGVANKEFQPLLEAYGSPYDLFNADEAEIERMPCSRGLKTRLADKSLAEANRIMEYCRANGVEILFWQDEQYPASLRPLRDPPVLLYYKGHLPALSARLCISVVGTRSMSEYGKRMAYKIGYELGSTGTVLVSGMALGNDSVAAAGAIAAGGYTVAVLGSGIDMVYPREHEKLYRETLRRGAVITEFPPATPPAGHNFPIRNRIISGLSQGTVVIEGDLRSGAMITAKTAILQGRDIYAFPGNVGETNSSGTNQLISDGASIVLCARDVLNNYAFLYRDTLDMTRLLKAETRSEPDDEHLERLGVCVRITNPRKAEETPLANADRASSEQSLRRSGSLSGSPSGNRGETLPSKETSPRPSAPRPQAVGADTPAPGGDSRGDLRKKPQAPAAPRPSLTGDSSQRILQRLTDTQRRIFEALPLDHAVPIDFLTREGFSTGEVMAAMTILEIHGLTVTLPGGLYARK